MWRCGCLEATNPIKKFIQSAGIPVGRHIRGDVSKREPRPEDAMPKMRNCLRGSLSVEQSVSNTVLDNCDAAVGCPDCLLYPLVVERV